MPFRALILAMPLFFCASAQAQDALARVPHTCFGIEGEIARADLRSLHNPATSNRFDAAFSDACDLDFVVAEAGITTTQCSVTADARCVAWFSEDFCADYGLCTPEDLGQFVTAIQGLRAGDTGWEVFIQARYSWASVLDTIGQDPAFQAQLAQTATPLVATHLLDAMKSNEAVQSSIRVYWWPTLAEVSALGPNLTPTRPYGRETLMVVNAQGRAYLTSLNLSQDLLETHEVGTLSIYASAYVTALGFGQIVTAVEP